LLLNVTAGEVVGVPFGEMCRRVHREQAGWLM